MREDTSPARMEADISRLDDAALNRLFMAGIDYQRTGAPCHRLVIAERARRVVSQDKAMQIVWDELVRDLREMPQSGLLDIEKATLWMANRVETE